MFDKHEIVEDLKKINQNINKLLSVINTYDATITLLSLLEILDNEENHVGRKTDDQPISDITSFMMVDTMLAKHEIREAIELLLKNSNNKQILDIVPPIETIFVIPSLTNRNMVEELVSRVYVRERGDLLRSYDVQMPGNLFGVRYISLQKFHTIQNNEQIMYAIKFFENFIRKKSYESLLKSGLSATLTEDKKFFESFPVTSQEIISKGLTRIIKSGEQTFPHYKNKIEQIERETLLSTELQANVPLQQYMHDREHMMYFEAFLEIPKFPQIFNQKTGITLEKYRDISLALKNIAKKRDTAVTVLPRTRLIVKLKKICKHKDKEIERVIELLQLKKGDSFAEKGIIFTGSKYIFSWLTITMPLRYPLLNIYDEFVNGDYSGKEFEKECREKIRSHSWTIFDESLVISKPIMPDEVSLELWGKKKQGTDIDVIAVRNNVLLITECKSEMPRFRRKERQLGEFSKYYQELQYKAIWIAKNFLEFKNLLSVQNFNIPQNIDTIIPIFVSRFIRPGNTEITTVTLKELGEIIEKLPEKINEKIDVNLDANVVVTLPAYKI